MFIIRNFLLTLAPLLYSLLGLYKWAVIIRILMTWINPDPYNPVVRALSRITEPYLEKFRKIIPPMGGIDFSPILAVFLIYFLQDFVPKTLVDIAQRI